MEKPAKSTLKGIVLDASTGKPLSSAQVALTLKRPHNPARFIDVIEEFAPRDKTLSAKTADDGVFRLACAR